MSGGRELKRELPPLVATAIPGKFLRWAPVGVLVLLAVAFAVRVRPRLESTHRRPGPPPTPPPAART